MASRRKQRDLRKNVLDSSVEDRSERRIRESQRPQSREEVHNVDLPPYTRAVREPFYYISSSPYTNTPSSPKSNHYHQEPVREPSSPVGNTGGDQTAESSITPYSTSTMKRKLDSGDETQEPGHKKSKADVSQLMK